MEFNTIYILILLGIIALTVILCSIFFTARTRRKLDFMLDALEDGETNFHFTGSRGINTSLNRLKALFDKEVTAIREREKYYGLLLDKVNTGIIVAEKDSGSVVYVNRIAREIIGIASISSMRQIRNVDKGIYEAFASGQDSVVSFTDERNRKSISVAISEGMFDGREVRIVAFNDISSSLENAETESWTKLIRVLTHEIMNTVTPIASLSDTLKEIDNLEEVAVGLDTISRSSRSLIRFVESYRSLTRVAAPVRKPFDVRELVEEVLELSNPLLSSSGTQVTFVQKSEDIFLYADRGQISQILVNLVKNAVQAGATRLSITAEIDKRDRVIINIENNGPAISAESQEQIFVPFYTTKTDGTGIGLSLSRQIMRLHGGNLTLLRSDADATIFSLIFQ